MLVGAVGLALAAGAQAERLGTIAPVMAPVDSGASSVSVNDNQNGAVNARQFAARRDAAVGAMGSVQRARVARDLERRINAGLLNPKKVLLADVGVQDFQFEGGERNPGLATGENTRLIYGDPSIGQRGISGGGLPAASYAYFDGFETYNIDTNPNDAMFAPGLGGQVAPSGEANFLSQFWYNAVNPAAVLYAADPDLIEDDPLPMPPNPFNPGGTGMYPQDRDPAVEQIMMIGRGNTSPVIQQTGFFNGINTAHQDFVPDGLSNDTDPGGVIYAVDF
ncbi:MAG: hypothetical protein VYC34_09880, partial [Planctomycetota bacterium]|nr:hypothetical protein [Planctomycetota bacterium]